ncbi:MAG: hypothetical protein OES84_02670, partial [Kiritimatiellaceae bacterium]|nr:hypothetical protein [Kiritimatiellaceae bacterium]
MHDIQSQFVKNILANTKTNAKNVGSAFAASNIALCKYWGKRDAALNLPINSSLSISLDNLGTRTEIRLSGGDTKLAVEATSSSLSHGKVSDLVYLNGKLQSSETSFAQRICA